MPSLNTENNDQRYIFYDSNKGHEIRAMGELYQQESGMDIRIKLAAGTVTGLYREWYVSYVKD